MSAASWRSSATRHGDGRVVATDWLVTDDGVVGVRVALALGAGERVVGFGERFDALDQRGRVLDTTVFEQYKQQGNRTYLPSPFAIVAGGERGWGFHVRTSRRVHFDVGRAAADRLLIELAVDPARPVVELRLYDGDPRPILAAHLAEVGGLRRPPDWVFHPWMSANDWNTQARVEAEVARSLELGVPVGAVVIEAWSDESTFTVFRDARYEVRPDGAPLTAADVTYPPDGAWPDPAGMIRRLGERDVRVLLWQIPVLPSGDDDGHRRDGGQLAADLATMTARAYCVGEADASPYRNRGWWFPGALLPDWTNPAATQWWLAKRRYLVDELGVAGFKTDGGEHAWGDELRYADGTRGAESNNRFALAYAEAYSSLFDGGEGTVFSRAGFTGAGRAPCHWAGDEDSTWPAFRASITAGLSAAVSGVAFWGWDLAGFSGELPTVELYVRATAMAALCPIMQYHSEFTGNLADADGRRPARDRTPWNVAEQRGDERALTLFRRFAVLRERLQPYLRAQADVCVARPGADDAAAGPRLADRPRRVGPPAAVPVRRLDARGAGVRRRGDGRRRVPARSGVGRRLERRGGGRSAPPPPRRALGRDRGVRHRRRGGVPPPALPRPPRPPPPRPRRFPQAKSSEPARFRAPRIANAAR